MDRGEAAKVVEAAKNQEKPGGKAFSQLKVLSSALRDREKELDVGGGAGGHAEDEEAGSVLVDDASQGNSAAAMAKQRKADALLTADVVVDCMRSEMDNLRQEITQTVLEEIRAALSSEGGGGGGGVGGTPLGRRRTEAGLGCVTSHMREAIVQGDAR